jgi:hypothetical protein
MGPLIRSLSLLRSLISRLYIITHLTELFLFPAQLIQSEINSNSSCQTQLTKSPIKTTSPDYAVTSCASNHHYFNTSAGHASFLYIHVKHYVEWSHLLRF